MFSSALGPPTGRSLCQGFVGLRGEKHRRDEPGFENGEVLDEHVEKSIQSNGLPLLLHIVMFIVSNYY